MKAFKYTHGLKRFDLKPITSRTHASESRPTLGELKKKRDWLVNELAFVEAGIKGES